MSESNLYEDYVNSLLWALREIKEEACLTDDEINEVVSYWKAEDGEHDDNQHYLYSAILELKPKGSLIQETVEKCFWDYEDLYKVSNE
jgi:hypothetical protein